MYLYYFDQEGKCARDLQAGDNDRKSFTLPVLVTTYNLHLI